MNKKKFLFIAANDHFANGIRLLAAILRRNGHDAEILFFRRFADDIKNRTRPNEHEWSLLENTISAYNADWIGVSLTSLRIIDEEKLFAVIRQAAPKAILMAGGFGPTFECERYLNFGADYICRGEGEHTIAEAARIIDTVKDISQIHNQLKKVPNLAWKENGKIHKNRLHPLNDLKNLPFPLYGNEYITIIEKNTVKKNDPMLSTHHNYGLLSSRGCIGRCTYCCGSSWQNIYREEKLPVKKYRARPTDEVIAECQNAKLLGAERLWFWDEFFVRPENDYFKFFNEYKQKIGLPFNMNANVEFMAKDYSRFKVMFDAGLRRVALGIQSASEFIIHEVFQRSFDANIKLQGIQTFHNHWVESCVHFITGHSMESENDFKDTLEFIKKLPFAIDWPFRTHLLTFSLGLYPGAAIGDRFPIIREQPMPIPEKEFRLRIMILRHIIKDDDEFNSIYNNKIFRKNPYLLNIVIKDTFNNLTSQFWSKKLEELKDREIIFFGCGQTYQLYKRRFKNCKPKAILVDTPENMAEIDGIKVVKPEDILTNNTTPIIIFSPRVGEIATNILRKFPEQRNLIACYNAHYPSFNIK